MFPFSPVAGGGSAVGPDRKLYGIDGRTEARSLANRPQNLTDIEKLLEIQYLKKHRDDE